LLVAELSLSWVVTPLAIPSLSQTDVDIHQLAVANVLRKQAYPTMRCGAELQLFAERVETVIDESDLKSIHADDAITTLKTGSRCRTPRHDRSDDDALGSVVGENSQPPSRSWTESIELLTCHMGHALFRSLLHTQSSFTRPRGLPVLTFSLWALFEAIKSRQIGSSIPLPKPVRYQTDNDQTKTQRWN
jgi:hypothetical protein